MITIKKEDDPKRHYISVELSPAFGNLLKRMRAKMSDLDAVIAIRAAYPNMPLRQAIEFIRSL